jgi:hypothetical protein
LPRSCQRVERIGVRRSQKERAQTGRIQPENEVVAGGGDALL